MLILKIVFALFLNFLIVASASKDHDSKHSYTLITAVDNCPNGGPGNCYLGNPNGYATVADAKVYCDKDKKCEYM